MLTPTDGMTSAALGAGCLSNKLLYMSPGRNVREVTGKEVLSLSLLVLLLYRSHSQRAQLFKHTSLSSIPINTYLLRRF